MTLYETLKTAKSEEDVKDIYIKALSLKGYTKGEVDIRTPKIWFEAKKGSDNAHGGIEPLLREHGGEYRSC